MSLKIKLSRKIILSLFQSMVLDECSRLVADSSEKSTAKIEELNSEIRKLKAMIGKNWEYLIINY